MPTPSLGQKLKPKTKTTFFLPKLKPFFMETGRKGKFKPKIETMVCVNSAMERVKRFLRSLNNEVLLSEVLFCGYALCIQ